MASIIAYTKAKMDQLLGLKANVADAVPLAGSGDLPANNGPVAFQGSASIAARSDHIHLLTSSRGYPIPEPSWSAPPVWGEPIGNATSSALDDGAALKAPLAPFPVPQEFTLKTILMYLHTAGDAGTFSLVLYATNKAGFATGAPLWQSSDTAATATGLKTFGSLTIPLTAGKYWLGFGSKGFSTTRPRPRRCGDGQAALLPASTDATWTPGVFISGFNETTGAWPTLAASGQPDLGTANSTSAFWFAIQGTPA